MISISKIKFWIWIILINRGKVGEMISVRRSERFKRWQIRKYQDDRLRRMAEYCYEHVPYYREIFDRIGVSPKDIQCAQDLMKLPILTKNDIRENFDRLVPRERGVPFLERTTGGSTGETLKFRVSKKSGRMAMALLLRGWSLGGYSYGDRVAILAGGSLVSKEYRLRERISDYFFSFRRYSSYGVSDQLFHAYFEDIDRFRPRYLRGYASSIFLLADFMQRKNIKFKSQIRGVFTTSEMLQRAQRDVIERVFKAPVYDGYGLDDGGVTAFECRHHNGFHIDFERAILEVVDDSGKQLVNTEGEIIATTLIEHAMPLLRYRTGDLGVISEEACTCGCERPLLKSIQGRVTDTLNLNGTVIGGPVLTVLMGKTKAKQYQFVQRSEQSLLIRISSDSDFREDEEFVRQSIVNHVGDIDVEFEYVKAIIPQNGMKHKFIINALD